MKYIPSLITCLLFISLTAGFSQNVEIPDISFKNALIAFGVDADSDNEISFAEAEAIDSLVVSEYEIKKLKGIEAFVNLRYFNCEDNLLDTIDLTFNTELTDLDISTNGIVTIDLTHNSKLQHVRAQNNYGLQHIDFSNCPELLSFDATSNDLQTLDLTNNPKLETLEVSIRDVPSIDLTQNTELIKLSLIYAYQLTELDLSENKKLESATVWLTKKLTVIDFTPCTALKSIFMTNNDDIESLYVSNLTQLNSIYINYSPSFSSIDISTCPNLSSLNVNSNNIDSLDLTNNPRLKSLKCGWNNITKLDLSAVDSLSTLECEYNNISTLDLANNTLLYKLQCHQNLLTELDLANNLEIRSINCSNNSLTVLDLTNNTAIYDLTCSNNQITKLINFNTTFLSGLVCNNNLLTELILENTGYFSKLNCSNNNLTTLNLSNAYTRYLNSFDATTNPDLLCIQVSDTTKAKDDWTNIDAQSYFSLNCGVVAVANEVFKSSVAVYPNPSNDGLFMVAGEAATRFYLLSSTGVVTEGKIQDNHLDFSTHEKGFYTLTLSNEEGNAVSEKIIIQ